MIQFIFIIQILIYLNISISRYKHILQYFKSIVFNIFFRISKKILFQINIGQVLIKYIIFSDVMKLINIKRK